MQPSSTHPQGYTQDHLTYTNQGYGRRSSPVRARHPTPFGFTQPMTPHYDPQPHTQGTFQDTFYRQPGGGNDAYRGIPVNGFGRTSTDPLGTGAPPPWYSGEYVPYFPHGQSGQSSINHTGFPVVNEQLPNNAMNLPHFPGTSAWQSDQGATPVWQLFDLNWVNYEAQGELHLTIVFRKGPIA